MKALTNPISLSKGRIRSVDTLKGIAIAAVVLVHSGTELLYLRNPTLGKFVSFGANGVQIFFILSAFTIFLSHHSRKEKNIIYFYFRRIFRLIPLYYLVLLFQIVILDNGSLIGRSYVDLLQSFLFLHGWNPILVNNGFIGVEWILTVEAMFYLICPLLFRYIKDIRRALYFVIFSLVLSFTYPLLLHKLSIIENQYLWNNFISFSFPVHLFYFSLGVLLFKLKDHLAKLITNKKGAAKLLAVTVALILIYLILFLQIKIISGTLIFILISMVILNVIEVDSSKIFSLLGTVSYGIYLTHLMVLRGVDYILWYSNINTFSDTLAYFIFRFLLILTISTGISFILHTVIEKPIIKKGNEVINDISRGKFSYKSLKALINF